LILEPNLDKIFIRRNRLPVKTVLIKKDTPSI
jgi:hypothetical protein